MKRVPVVVLTTWSERLDIESCYDMGASPSIIKPSTFDELVKAMSNLGAYWFGIVELPPRSEGD